MTRFTHILGPAACAALLVGAQADASGPNFVGNVIIEGSLCVGFDCVVGMGFGFDTVVLRENNLRILFDDSSTVGAFPNNDWRFVINNSTNGGFNFFALEDATAGQTPFRVEAGAPSNSLYVEDTGEIGLGTNSPVVELHVKDGNTPTLRLEQDGTSGFAPQSWDVAGNEAGFFIRDATGGSTLPFRIRPGAPSQSLVIADTGNVGISTGLTPSARLTVDTNATEALTIQGDGTKHLDMISDDDNPTQLRLITASNTRNIVAQDTAAGGADVRIAMQNDRILLTGPDAVADQWLRVNAAGITTPGTVTSGGPTCGGGCDAVFDPEIYTVPSIEEHAALMWENKHLPAVGPTRPGEPMNVTEKLGTMLNELEHAHIYIEELHKRIERLEALIEADKG